jgi:hypothetical protein
MDALRRSIEAEKAAPARAVAVTEKKAPSKARVTGKSQDPVKRRPAEVKSNWRYVGAKSASSK